MSDRERTLVPPRTEAATQASGIFLLFCFFFFEFVSCFFEALENRGLAVAVGMAAAGDPTTEVFFFFFFFFFFVWLLPPTLDAAADGGAAVRAAASADESEDADDGRGALA